MKTVAKNVLRWAGAILLIAAGLVLAVPGIPGPGLLVVLLGLALLLPLSRGLRKAYVRAKERWPRLFHPFEARRRRKREERGGGGGEEPPG